MDARCVDLASLNSVHCHGYLCQSAVIQIVNTEEARDILSSRPLGFQNPHRLKALIDMCTLIVCYLSQAVQVCLELQISGMHTISSITVILYSQHAGIKQKFVRAQIIPRRSLSSSQTSRWIGLLHMYHTSHAHDQIVFKSYETAAILGLAL